MKRHKHQDSLLLVLVESGYGDIDVKAACGETSVENSWCRVCRGVLIASWLDRDSKDNRAGIKRQASAM
jgi:hypothetical protein